MTKSGVTKECLFDKGPMSTQKRVALSARVSTMDKGQDPETQLLTLRAYAERRGFLRRGEYIDSARGTREDRPQYHALCAAVRKRQVDVVFVWRYDRFACSTQALMQALKAFQSLAVDFISYQEHIDTTTPQGEMIFTVMASLAQCESALMSARVKAGMARAKAQGKRIARAPRPTGTQASIATLYKQGISIAQISTQPGIGYGTAWHDVQPYKQHNHEGGEGVEPLMMLFHGYSQADDRHSVSRLPTAFPPLFVPTLLDPHTRRSAPSAAVRVRRGVQSPACADGSRHIL